MKKQNKTITIREYGFISTNPHWIYEDYFSAYVDSDTFEEIKTFLLDEKNQSYNILTLSRRNWYGEIITAQNYVGVIQTSNGTSIEILPKISNITDIDKTRDIFLKMLKTLKDSPFKNIDKASLKTQKFPILEIFISLFLDELDRLIKRWIKRNYVLQEENIWFLKGKLKVAQNIKQNLTHKERFFCQFDEFTENIRENKLIKKCLMYLNGLSKKEKNRQRIKEFMFVFSDIEATTTVKEDLKAIQNLNRLNNYYADTLQWVRIFLLWQSVVNFVWHTLTLALLFPMEKIFESYVAKKLVQHNPDRKIKTQDTAHYLVEYHKDKPKFNLRPDIVINGWEIVADTKWKLLDGTDESINYGISQSDMYQLFAYAKKYKSKKLYLIYPKTDTFTTKLEPFFYHYLDEQISLEVVPYDLENDTCEMS